MARVTPQGIEPTPLQGYVDRLGEAFRSALGTDLDLAPETPQGQLIGVVALTLAEADEALVAVANGFSLDHAMGFHLDALGSLLGINRLAATHSTAAVTITGQAGTTIPEVSRARTGAGEVFALTAEAVIPASGSLDATMQAVEEGPVAAPGGDLTEIVDLAAGWEAVSNPAAATLGRRRESDDEYRLRYARHTARNARSSTEAILAAVLETEGVTRALIRENATAAAVTAQGQEIGAHSVYLVAEGGNDAEIAGAIATSKTVGTGTSGDTLLDVPHAGGWTVPIRFSRVNAVPVSVTLGLTIQAGFPSDGTSRMIRQVMGFIGGLGIGEALNPQRLLAAVLSVPGHTVDLGVGRKGGTVVSGTGTVASLETFHGRATVLTGGNHSTLATLQAITAGSVTFLGQTVSSLDFSSDNDLDGVASTLQTALRATGAAGLTNVEITHNGAVFVVTLPLDSNGAATSVSNAFSGTESDELGLDTAAIAAGVDAIKTGSVTFMETSVSDLDFSGVTTYEGVAGVLQTALRGASIQGLAETLVTYGDTGFVVTIPLDGDGNPVIVTGAFTGDTADELGLDTVQTAQGSVTDIAYLRLNDRLTIESSDITITTA